MTALVWFDGFDHYSGISSYGSTYTGIAGAGASYGTALGSISTTTRFGVGQCVQSPSLYKSISGVNGFSQLTVGFAAQLNGDGGSTNLGFNPVITCLYDPTNAPLYTIFYDAINNRVYFCDATLNFFTFNGPTGVFSSAGSYVLDYWSVPASNAWYYFEFIWEKGTTTSNGTLKVNINGQSVYSNSSINVGTTTAALWTCSTYINNNPWQMDDFYIANTTTPLGDSRIVTLFPDSDTTVDQFNTSNGTSHYSLVNSLQANANNYVYSNVVGAQDYYNVQAYNTVTTIPPATIYAVKTSALTRKDLAGNRFVQTNIIANGMVSTGNSTALSQTYLYQQDIHNVDPSTGLAWTEQGVSNAQIGIEITS